MAARSVASRDGAFLTGILEWFGVQPVRGFNQPARPAGVARITTWAERGYDLTITPDGRGTLLPGSGGRDVTWRR